MAASTAADHVISASRAISKHAPREECRCQVQRKIANNAMKTAEQKYDNAVVVKELIALYRQLAGPDR